MVLIGFSWIDTLTSVLTVTIVILAIIILYRRLLKYLSRNSLNKEEYCELYNLEQSPAVGELQFYFTSSKIKKIKLLILNDEMELVHEVDAKECHVGGNIIRFDSSKLKNGSYFYCLETDNQKTMKKMEVMNG